MKSTDDLIQELDFKLSQCTNPQDCVKELIDFQQVYGDTIGEAIQPRIDKVTQEANDSGYLTGLVISYITELNFWALTKGKEPARRFLPDSLSLDDMLQILKVDKRWYPLGLMYQAFYYWFHGDYEKGFNLIFEAIKTAEGTSEKDLAWCSYVLGVFYFDTKDFETSENYYDKAIYLHQKIGGTYGLARALSGKASIAIQHGKLDEAEHILAQADKLLRELSHASGLSRVLTDMGNVYKMRGNFTKACTTFQESIELRKSLQHIQGLATTYTELGETCLLSGEVYQALVNLKEGLRHAEDVDSKQKCMRIHKLLAEVYKKMNNIPLALSHLERWYELKTVLLGDEAANNIKKIQTRFEKEKAEQVAEIERLKNVELKDAYQIIQEQNAELKDTIDELTKTKISRKAILLTLLLAIVLFLLSEGFIDPAIESHSQSLALSMAGKLLIALMLKPLEGLIERLLLKRVMNKTKMLK